MKRLARSILSIVLLLSLVFQTSPTPVSGKPAVSASPKQPKKRPLNAESKQRQQRALDSLKEAKVVQLYSLDPDGIRMNNKQLPPSKVFNSWEILGQCQVTPEEGTQLLDALRDGLRIDNAQAAACFDPRHGLRLETPEGPRDVVICFACCRVQINSGTGADKKSIGAIIHGGGNVFYSIVKKHHLPKPKDPYQS